MTMQQEQATGLAGAAKTETTMTQSETPQISATQQAKQTAKQIKQMLDEENPFLIFRLVQLFGATLVEAKAQEALEAWQQAQDTGPSAYVVQPSGTQVARADGQPRTKGGVFFQIMREYCHSVGLNWYALFPAQSQKQPPHAGGGKATGRPQKGRVAEVTPKADVAQVSTRPIPASNGTASTAKPVSTQPAAASKPAPTAPVNIATPTLSDAAATPKPSRGKVTITGTLGGVPKRDAERGLVELVFQIEMSPGLPKGLPNLGTSRVIVVCTVKQFEKVAETTTVTPQTRFLVEGEPSPAVNRDLQPFLKVICLRLTTMEMEQARVR